MTVQRIVSLQQAVKGAFGTGHASNQTYDSRCAGSLMLNTARLWPSSSHSDATQHVCLLISTILHTHVTSMPLPMQMLNGW